MDTQCLGVLQGHPVPGYINMGSDTQGIAWDLQCHTVKKKAIYTENK